jgi:2-octaprenylphenol hydroxylase
MNEYDVIIVGAGMVGASMACLLSETNKAGSRSPIKIAVVEAIAAQPFTNDNFDPRVAAITEKSRRCLERCDVWSSIEKSRVSPYLSMNVWDAESTGRISFDCDEIRQPNLGHIVESRVIVSALLEKIAEHDHVDLICPAKIVDYRRNKNNIMIDLDGTHSLSAKLLIGADGGSSKVRDHFGFKLKEWDYQQEAIVSTISTEKPNERTAWQSFTAKGPLAFLPLNDKDNLHHCSLVWSQDSDTAQKLMSLDDKNFCDALTVASESCLGEILSIDKRFSFPLIQRHAAEYAQPRVVLVGDAAHTIHPLAGQGVNLGFSDIEVLVDEIHRAWFQDIDIGNITVLSRYQRRRKSENLAMMALMEGFKRLFATDRLSMRLLRSLGMSKLDDLNFLKTAIIKKAMGV